MKVLGVNRLIDADLSQELNGETPVISNIDNESTEQQSALIMEEAGETFNNMKKDKTPGSDGFIVNFFQYFWRNSKRPFFLDKQMTASWLANSTVKI